MRSVRHGRRVVQETVAQLGELDAQGCARAAVPSERVYEERLYRTLDRLLPHKEAIEAHLVKRFGELFELDYDLLLYPPPSHAAVTSSAL